MGLLLDERDVLSCGGAFVEGGHRGPKSSSKGEVRYKVTGRLKTIGPVLSLARDNVEGRPELRYEPRISGFPKERLERPPKPIELSLVFLYTSTRYRDAPILRRTGNVSCQRGFLAPPSPTVTSPRTTS